LAGGTPAFVWHEIDPAHTAQRRDVVGADRAGQNAIGIARPFLFGVPGRKQRLFLLEHLDAGLSQPGKPLHLFPPDALNQEIRIFEQLVMKLINDPALRHPNEMLDIRMPLERVQVDDTVVTDDKGVKLMHMTSKSKS